tara:strand:+ start:568 stop:1230 length:663 start_codon:yes stop_codon:yes gene_type:complete
MANPYFSYVPNFEYVSRLSDALISDYVEVKNLFKRLKVPEDIFGDLTNFTKYQIEGDERPDQVAFKLYQDQYLDWLILLSNNVINFEHEWPLNQQSFYNYLLSKYKTEDNFIAVHHYETVEVKNSKDIVIIEKGLEVPETYSMKYLDNGSLVTASNITTAITNYEYEEKIQTSRRNIFTLKPQYVTLALNSLEENMPYKAGSSQFVSENLVKGENIRLYS